MKKISIAIFGINDPIWNAIINEINPTKAEIITFIDNDETKWGTYYRGIPVVSLEIVDKNAVDFFLVAALSAYEEVKNQLMEYGICEERIQLFVTNQLCQYCVGDIEDINLELIHKIYFEPRKRIDNIQEYHRIYRIYNKIPAFQDKEEWFSKSNLVSHACGGVVNGKRIEYSNSKEAFMHSIKMGFKIIECDILLANNEIILAHNYKNFYEAEEKNYTMMNAKELLLLLKEYPHISCLIDVKWDNQEEYSFCVKGMDNLIQEICTNKDEYSSLKKQIIMEVYDESTIKIAKDIKFDMFFTQYRNSEENSLMEVANICYKYGIKIIGYPKDWVVGKSKFFKLITDKNIKIYVYSSDSIEEYENMRKLGVKGIFTNYLVEKDI